MTRILVIDGHPRAESLCAALAASYRDGAQAAGHETRVIALRDLRFDPFATKSHDPVPLEDDLVAAREAILWAGHVVWVWPLWFGLPPALVKAFVERALTAGFAIELRPDGWPGKRLLAGRSARMVVPMSMPVWFYRFWTGAHATRAFGASVLEECGFGPVRQTLYGYAHRAEPETVERWRGEMRALGAEAR